jgi:hypothetical protein
VHPRVVVAETAPLTVNAYGRPTARPRIELSARPAEPPIRPWLGTYDGEASAWAPDGTASEPLDITLEITEPITTADDVGTEQPPLKIAIDVAERGWTIVGTATVPHCPHLDNPPCPCE